MIEGNYTRIVVVPTIRMLNSTIAGQTSSTSYFKFYLPTLVSGVSPHLSQSITMTGDDILKIARSDVSYVRISVTFPNAASGFDSNFFNFDHNSETVHLTAGSVAEFYLGNVVVSLGKV